MIVPKFNLIKVGPSEVTFEDLEKAFELAEGISTGTLNFKGKFKIVPQLPEGISFWAQKVREKKMQSSDILWALEENEEKITWIAVRILLKGNYYTYNLQNREDRKSLKLLEKRLKEREK